MTIFSGLALLRVAIVHTRVARANSSNFVAANNPRLRRVENKCHSKKPVRPRANLFLVVFPSGNGYGVHCEALGCFLGALPHGFSQKPELCARKGTLLLQQVFRYPLVNLLDVSYFRQDARRSVCIRGL